MNKADVSVRNAAQTDLDRVSELEVAIFSAQNIAPFSRGHFSAWLEVYPQGFFVAEQAGIVVGYTYTQLISADFACSGELTRWTSFDVMTDCGYTRASHCPGGNYHLGVNIGSVVPGAGKILVESLVQLAASLGKPLLGMSRISGLRNYVQKLVQCGVVGEVTSRADKDAIALSYTMQCVNMVGGRMKLLETSPGRDCSNLPDLPVTREFDPVLCKYLRNPRFAVWAILPEFIEDPDSLNYAVLTGPPD